MLARAKGSHSGEGEDSQCRLECCHYGDAPDVMASLEVHYGPWESEV